MNDMRSVLVQMLRGRLGGDSSLHLQEALQAQINQRPPGDPLRDLLSQMLAQSQPAAQKPKADPQTLLRAARDALNRMQERQMVLAAALGACPECWGEEADCPHCNGLGRPGWGRPDPVAFGNWVAPAIHATTNATHKAPADEEPAASFGSARKSN
jgi:hypothetical protein